MGFRAHQPEHARRRRQTVLRAGCKVADSAVCQAPDCGFREAKAKIFSFPTLVSVKAGTLQLVYAGSFPSTGSGRHRFR